MARPKKVISLTDTTDGNNVVKSDDNSNQQPNMNIVPGSIIIMDSQLKSLTNAMEMLKTFTPDARFKKGVCITSSTDRFNIFKVKSQCEIDINFAVLDKSMKMLKLLNGDAMFLKRDDNRYIFIDQNGIEVMIPDAAAGSFINDHEEDAFNKMYENIMKMPEFFNYNINQQVLAKLSTSIKAMNEAVVNIYTDNNNIVTMVGDNHSGFVKVFKAPYDSLAVENKSVELYINCTFLLQAFSELNISLRFDSENDRVIIVWNGDLEGNKVMNIMSHNRKPSDSIN